KMDIDLFINKYAISIDGDDYVIAVEFLDEEVAEESVYLVRDWFRAITEDRDINFGDEFLKLQEDFDSTLFGGPTIYSLIEAGLKRSIPVFFLFEENQFQWGYGKKNLRGRSTTVSTDGIKDTEFTMYKDMVGDFLMMCGFPTPIGKNCFDENEIVDEALKLGFPVVVKPVAGHKGQGVVTGIENEEGVKKAFNDILGGAEAEGINFEGAIVQQQIYGTDHRLLAVGAKFAAALERVPAFVVGNGKDAIKDLIEVENDKEIRLDNARSPLAKIHIDDDLKDFLELQSLTLNSIPAEDEKIELRRVANISAGGVSINVTDKIHPDNIKMVEDIAGFFDVKCLGIDVLSADISKPWRDGNFGIIEINAGPGVFIHRAPAYGGSIDVPGLFIRSHFLKDENARIPIIAGNKLSQNFANLLNNKLHEINNNIYFSSLTEEGIHFNGNYFFKNEKHNENVKIILRNPKTEFALFTHNFDNIFDYGILHEEADVVILDNPHYAEEKTLLEQLLPDGILVEINDNSIEISGENIENKSISFEGDQDKDAKMLEIIEPLLGELMVKYD
ncbi:MAG: hypothetical protein K8R68_11260, partial [Bacteroidales bacterium]|nr:hypothetical protein [Bacteroidales bacterium]